MSGLAGQAIGLDVQSPTPIGGDAAIDSNSKGSMENFIGFGLGATSYDPAPVDFSVVDDTVTSADDGLTRVSPEYIGNQLVWPGGSGGGVLIPAPAGFPPVPFGAEFYKVGSSYTTDFVVKSPIAEGDEGVKTVYVDIATGVDTNPGTEALPYKSINGALLANSYTVTLKLLMKVKPGTYGVADNFNEKVPEQYSFSCVPWGEGTVICSNEIPDRVWTLSSGSTWYCDVAGFGYAEYGSTVWDGKSPNQWGDYIGLAKVADLATCNSTAGSYFVDTALFRVYVHTLDGRQPDANIHVFQAWNAPGQFSSHGSLVQNLECYFEGFAFLGGQASFNLQQQNAGVHTTAQFKNCQFKYASGSGVFYVLGAINVALEDCIGSSGYSDIFTYQSYGANAPPTALEVNVEARMSGVPMAGTANQGSTMHNGGTIVRLNGNYHNNENDQIADVAVGTNCWLIGCSAKNGRKATYSGYHFGNVPTEQTTAWLEGCDSAGNTYGITSYDGSVVHIKDFTSDAPNSGAGSITPY
jgi:hypothetical protein